jgi:AGZA family xanthine/uracil permease-like MFS transporter
LQILAIRKVRGAILIGVMLITLLSIFMGIINFQGLVSYPPSFLPIFMKLDILGALDLAMISIITSFLFVNLFDTAGTLLGVANQAKLVNDSGKILNLDKALKADSSSSAIGAFLGCAPVTSYIESSAGAEAGGTNRTNCSDCWFFIFNSYLFFSIGKHHTCSCNSWCSYICCHINAGRNGEIKLV